MYNVVVLFVHLLEMWRTIARMLRLDADGDDDDDTDEEDEAENSSSRCTDSSSKLPAEEQREFIGVVTSLHSAYGLIDHEICFTVEAVSGSLPTVGDRVHVVASRKNAMGGWRAKRVWAASDDDFFNETETAASSHLPNKPLSSKSDARGALPTSEPDCQELLNNQVSVSVTDCIDFGNMQLGESSSLNIVIRCYAFIIFS